MIKPSLLQNQTAPQLVKKYLTILLGSLIYAVGFQFFMYPNHIVAGGCVGISMIINRLTGLPVGVTNMVLNIPLFLVAWKHFGLGFLVGSLAGTYISSFLVDLLAATGVVATLDPMLGAIIGGVIKGAGLGIIYSVGATTGGADIVIKFLRQRFSQINFGTMMLLLDGAIVVAYAVILNQYASAMYSLIGMYVVTKVIDLILYGIDNSCICYIISDKSEALIHEIIDGRVHRGVTILEGEGAYSRAKKHIIMCVVKRTQIPDMRRMVRAIDEHAFFIVSDAKNVFGNGFENIAEVR